MRAEVAPRTAEMYSEFWRCGVCRRVYWEGNTFRQALAHYAQFAEPKKPGAAAEGEGEVSEILTRNRQCSSETGSNGTFEMHQMRPNGEWKKLVNRKAR